MGFFQYILLHLCWLSLKLAPLSEKEMRCLQSYHLHWETLIRLDSWPACRLIICVILLSLAPS